MWHILGMLHITDKIISQIFNQFLTTNVYLGDKNKQVTTNYIIADFHVARPLIKTCFLHVWHSVLTVTVLFPK